MAYWKTIRNYTISIVIIAFVTATVLVTVVDSARNVYDKNESIIDAFTEETCVKRENLGVQEGARNAIILRLDDAQADLWSGVSIAMMQEILNQGLTVSAGVIPRNIESDRKMVSFLKSQHCNLEIVLHGWDHGRSLYDVKNDTEAPPEFRGLSFDQARELIVKGKKKLKDVFGVDVTTFIPPNNESSDGTKSALKAEGFTVYSSDEGGTFDYTEPTYDFVTKSLIDINHVLEACQRRFDKEQFCVIMLHPQEYSNADRTLNQDAFNNHFIPMLTKLKEGGSNFYTFKHMNEAGVRDITFEQHGTAQGNATDSAEKPSN